MLDDYYTLRLRVRVYVNGAATRMTIFEIRVRRRAAPRRAVLRATRETCRAPSKGSNCEWRVASGDGFAIRIFASNECEMCAIPTIVSYACFRKARHVPPRRVAVTRGREPSRVRGAAIRAYRRVASAEARDCRGARYARRSGALGWIRNEGEGEG